MEKYHVSVMCDVKAKVTGKPLRYRVFVNNELFTERTWAWKKAYLEELLPIHAEPGYYSIEYQTIDPESGSITADNFRVVDGLAKMHHIHTSSLDLTGTHAVEILDAMA